MPLFQPPRPALPGDFDPLSRERERAIRAEACAKAAEDKAARLEVEIASLRARLADALAAAADARWDLEV